MATNNGKGFWGAVIVLVLIALVTAYAAVMGARNTVAIADQGGRIDKVEQSIKDTPKKSEVINLIDKRIVAEEAEEANAFRRIATTAATQAVDEHQKSSYHHKAVKPRVVQHVKQTAVVRQPQVAVAEQPKLVLPKVGDPCPYGVVYVDVDAGGAQHIRCGPVQQVSQPAPARVVEVPAPRDDFYDRVQFVPQRRAPDPIPIQHPVQAPVQETNSGSSWTPWIVGAVVGGVLWYANAHRGGAAVVGLPPTGTTGPVGIGVAPAATAGAVGIGVAPTAGGVVGAVGAPTPAAL